MISIKRSFKDYLKLNRLIRQLNRYSTESSGQTLNFTQLTNRKVLKVSGKDAFSYIQLMTTNNLQQKFNCLNSFMTTPNSKILCDLLIYKIKGDVFDKELILNGLTNANFGKRLIDCLKESDEELDNELNGELSTKSNKELKEELINDLKQYSSNEASEEILYLECDANLIDHIRKTLFVRNLHYDVKLEILDDLKVFTAYSQFDDDNLSRDKFILNNEYVSSYFICVNDPRLPYLGQRIITKLPVLNLIKLLNDYIFMNVSLKKSTIKDYKLNRYKLGVGEGLKEHYMAATLLSSFNADFLNGISLYKGGYLGSTLVKRIVKRKDKHLRRLLPFKFINHSPTKTIDNFPTGLEFVEDDQLIGKYINNVDSYGIGYFKLNSFAQINKCRSIKVKLNFENANLDALIKIPFWWPDEILQPDYLTYEDDLLRFKKQLKTDSNLMLNE